MNKKGFTLVELLAVIAILALLVILAMPNILRLFNNARKNSFVVEARTIFKEAESQYVKEQFKGNKISKISSTSEKTSLDLNGKKLDYCVILDNNGKVSKIAVGNNNFHILLDDINAIDDLDVNKVEDGELSDVICTLNTVKKRKKCLFDGDLKPGAEYVEGQFTYRYKQQYDSTGSWKSVASDGWGVTLTDLDSTEPVTTELCKNIKDKPIVSMANMFRGSKTTEIDLESFDTSEVTNMGYMFQGVEVTTLDLSNFDTSKVTTMISMFGGCKSLTNLDLSNLNVPELTTTYEMFANCSSLTNLDVSGWNASKLKSMYRMFRNCSSLTNLNLSNFDTSGVTNMTSLFEYCTHLEKLDLSSFYTEKVEKMDIMFSSMPNLKKIDLSNFNTNSVTNVSNMFSGDYKLTNIDLSNASFDDVTNSSDMLKNVPVTATIKLKDTPENRNFIQTNFPKYTPIYVN